MKRTNFKLSALLLTVLLIASLGATTAFASDTVKEIRFKRTTTAEKAGTFQIWFTGFSRFFRLADRFINPCTPPVPEPTFQPEDAKGQSIFYFSVPQDSTEDQQSPEFIDDSDPIG